MKKQTLSSKILCVILAAFFVLMSFSGCSTASSNNKEKDTDITMSIVGVEIINSAALIVVNESTGEEVEILFSRYKDYISEVSLDYGEYTIKKARPTNKRYELLVIDKTFKVGAATKSVVITLAEEDVSGTFSYFLKNNGFLLIALCGCFIALGVVRSKNNKAIKQKNAEE